MPKSAKVIVVIIIITAISLLYNYKYLNEFPSHIHAWAQSDRYALSFGFIDNNFDFFKPQNFIYNKQFPDTWETTYDYTITAVDFPIHDFIPAVLMKITGNNSPMIFRLYIFLYSIIGLFFLYKTAYFILKDTLKSSIVILFASTSPVFVYYQAGFLPTIPSLSNSIIAFYLYFVYLQNNKQNYFIGSVVLFTLATLARSTFAIPFITVLGVEFIRVFRKESNFLRLLINTSVSFLIILAYYLHNSYLRKIYGSDFLNYFLLPESIEQVKEILRFVHETWLYQYFTKPHYLLLSILVLIAFFKFKYSTFKKDNLRIYLFISLFFYFLGSLLFAVLMLRQFTDHDYYFLDIFYLPILFLLIFVLGFIPSSEKQKNKRIVLLATICIGIILIIQPLKSQEKRRETGSWDKTQITLENFNSSSRFLDSLKISRNAKILVINAIAPNIPFILMNRKGYAVMNVNRTTIEKSLKWNFDYIVFQNVDFISCIYSNYPEIILKIKKIADNGKITICKLSDSSKNQTITSFYQLQSQKPVFSNSITFEEKIIDSSWQNYCQISGNAYSGIYSGIMDSKTEFGLTYKTKLPEYFKKHKRLLSLNSMFMSLDKTDCEVVVSIKKQGKDIYYHSVSLNNFIRVSNKWTPVSLIFEIPEISDNEAEFAFYLWNNGKCKILYDNFVLSIY